MAEFRHGWRSCARAKFAATPAEIARRAERAYARFMTLRSTSPISHVLFALVSLGLCACGNSPEIADASTDADASVEGDIDASTSRVDSAADGSADGGAAALGDGGAVECLGANQGLNREFQACATSADCKLVSYDLDCCGSTHTTAVNASKLAEVEACIVARRTAGPRCKCPALPPVTDDGKSTSSTTDIAVECVVVGGGSHVDVLGCRTRLR